MGLLRGQDVLVAGGGVIGLAIAERLARGGARVRLIEAERLGSGASGAAAGMLAPFTEALLHPDLLALGLESLAAFGPLAARLLDETGIDVELERGGTARFAFDEADRGALLDAKHRLSEQLPASWPLDSIDWLDEVDARARWAGLSRRTIGALVFSKEAHLRPPRLIEALERSARMHGVEVEVGTRVLALRNEGDRLVGVETTRGSRVADSVVLCAGPWTPSLLGPYAEAIGRDDGRLFEIEPVRGQILALGGVPAEIPGMVRSENIYLVPKRDGTLIVGATEERVGFDRRVTADGIATLLERARAICPMLAEATFLEAWAGLRPTSRDGAPYVDRVPGVENLLVAAGHGRNGILLSAVTADRIAELVFSEPRASSTGSGVSPSPPAHSVVQPRHLPGP